MSRFTAKLTLLALVFIAFAAKAQTQRSYVSAADGSTQPYWVYLPPDYSATKKYPLVIFLHGYDPALSKTNPWLPDESIWSVFTSNGFVLAVPYGRRNSDFVDIGEDDVLRVRREMLREYSIDENRVFLLGVSMGAYGAYADALHHPDLWNGVAALSGRADFYQWFDLNRDDLPDWKKVLFDANDPRHLAQNAAELPFFIQHGALDHIVPVQQSRLFVADLHALGNEVRYQEYPDTIHYLYFENQPYLKVANWFKSIQPISAPPREVQFITGTLRDGKRNWVNITAMNRYDRLASIEARVTKDNTVEVTACNVAGFEIDPPKVLFSRSQNFQIKLNGVLLPQKHAIGKKVVYPKTPPTQSFPGYKTAQRSGPIKACFRDPFMVVYGTKNPEDEKHARRFISEWQQYADGMPPLKADKEINAQDRKKYNLVLFGTPQSNSLLAKAAGQLPIKFTDNGYQLGQKYFSAKNTGVIFCYPSPFSNQRMIVVQAGLYWGAALPINHKWDLLPEYIVYNDSVENENSWHDEIKTNHALEAGFFDHHWKLIPPF